LIKVTLPVSPVLVLFVDYNRHVLKW